jgi:hypothetical protein
VNDEYRRIWDIFHMCNPGKSCSLYPGKQILGSRFWGGLTILFPRAVN